MSGAHIASAPTSRGPWSPGCCEKAGVSALSQKLGWEFYGSTHEVGGEKSLTITQAEAHNLDT